MCVCHEHTQVAVWEAFNVRIVESGRARRGDRPGLMCTAFSDRRRQLLKAVIEYRKRSGKS